MTQTVTAAKSGRDGAPPSPADAPLRPNERIVYDALIGRAGPVKAYALLDHLNDHGVRSPMTVYRALGALVEKGLARKVHSQNAFVAVAGTEGQAAYVTCRRCEETRAVGVDAALLRLACPHMPPGEADVSIEVATDCGGWCGRDKTAS